MSKSHDIYAIAGRIKNIIANEGIALSPVGTILVNYYSLALKDFYDYSEKLPSPFKEELQTLLSSKEDVPCNVIKVSTLKDDGYETLYEQVMRAKPHFGSNEEALEHYTQEYRDLTESYGLEGDEFWAQAEASEHLTEDHRTIMRLSRSIQMAKYLIQKSKEKQSHNLPEGEEYG